MEYALCRDGEMAWRIHTYVKWTLQMACTFLEFMMDTEVNICQVLLFTGHEVAEFVKEHLIPELKNLSSFKEKKYD